jgi:rifamycin polyketide synthase module 1/2/3
VPGRLDGEAVLAVARQRLSSFKLPERLIECEQIPRTGSGKILRFRLKEEATGGISHADHGSLPEVPSPAG